MASTKAIYGTVIKKLKFKKIMKIILDIIAFFIGVRFSLSILSSVLVQIEYMCKRVSVKVCSKIPFSKNPHRKETSQPICSANQLTGFFNEFY